jgi:protein-tyrosine phosphatase
MIDIHCHPLSGIDDGAETFEVSVAMCQMAAADGITHLVATPHCNYRYEFQPELNRKKVEELQAAVGDTPKLLLGCDFNLSYDNIRRLVEHSKDFTVNRTNYILVELGDQFIPEQFDQVFYEIEVAGLTPILTHPERNRVVRNKPELVYHWVTRGCLVQVTAQSYSGGFGSEAQRLTEMWLDRNLIHFFASDAHDLKHRPPLLSPCNDKLVETKGKAVADLLLEKNPRSVIQGLPLPPGLEPVGPSESRRKRSWFSSFWR